MLFLFLTLPVGAYAAGTLVGPPEPPAPVPAVSTPRPMDSSSGADTPSAPSTSPLATEVTSQYGGRPTHPRKPKRSHHQVLTPTAEPSSQAPTVAATESLSPSPTATTSPSAEPSPSSPEPSPQSAAPSASSAPTYDPGSPDVNTAAR